MIGMKKMSILGVVLTLCVLLPAIVTPVFAQSKLVFVGNFGGASVPMHEGMMVEFLDFNRSPVGRADCIIVSMMTNGEVPICVVTDNEEMGELFDEIFTELVPIVVVDDEKLEVGMKGRAMYAELTVTAGPIHPISAQLKGCYGEPLKGMEGGTMPNGWEMMMTYISYEAVVYFVSDGVPCDPTVGMVGPQFLMKITPS